MKRWIPEFWPLAIVIILQIAPYSSGAQSVVVVKPVVQAPVVDGVGDDDCWRKADALTLMRFDPSGKPTDPVKPAATVKIVAAADALYVLIEVDESTPSKLVYKDRLEDKLATEIWYEDHWELFIGALRSNKQFQFLGDTRNRVVCVGNGMASYVPEGNSATLVGASSWTAELRIPAKQLGVDLAKQPAFRFNVYRVRRVGGQQLACWAPVKGRFSDWPNFGWLTVGEFADTTWLKQRFLGPDEQRELVDVRKAFSRFKAGEGFHAEFQALDAQVQALMASPEKVTSAQWQLLAADAELLPDRLHRLWQDTKLLEIIH